tara:strand:+ start:277 stop:630 length:354 start_codon:yes stop_codon:yes gene_type:complete
MFTLYGIPNCNSIKKAKVWLDENGIEYVFHDYKKKGISPEKLANWTNQVSWNQLVNKAGTTWKKLTPEVKESIIDAGAAEKLMFEQNSVIKRPVLENNSGEIVSVGFSESDYQTKLK